MKIINRIYINLSRLKFYTIFIFLILFVSCTLFIAIQKISQGITITRNTIENTIPVVITLDKTQEFVIPEIISTEVISEIGLLEQVTSYDFSFLELKLSDMTRYNPNNPWGFRAPVVTTRHEELESYFNLFGTSRSIPINVEHGLYELIEGRFFTEQEVSSAVSEQKIPALIPQEIAILNNLTLGSVFNLYVSMMVMPDEEQFEYIYEIVRIGPQWSWHPAIEFNMIKYEFEVIGILSLDFKSVVDYEDYFMQDYVFNSFIVPNIHIENLLQNNLKYINKWNELFYDGKTTNIHDISGFQVFWVLESVGAINSFLADANYLLPLGYYFSHRTYLFNPLINTLSSIENLISSYLILIGGILIIMLTLLFLINISLKKQEIGIYLALGESKLKIILQILGEVFILTFISFSLALIFSGVLLISPIRNFLINEIGTEVTLFQEPNWVWCSQLQSMTIEEVFPSQLEFGGISRNYTIDELVELFDININFQTVIISKIGVIILIGLASIVPIIYFVEISPLKLLLKSRIE